MKMNKKRNITLKGKKGFTLLEAIISLAIFLIGVSAIVTISISSINLMMKARIMDKDSQVLAEAIRDRNSVQGKEIRLITEEKNKVVTFTINEDLTFDVKGKYVIVESRSTGAKYSVFLPEK